MLDADSWPRLARAFSCARAAWEAGPSAWQRLLPKRALPSKRRTPEAICEHFERLSVRPVTVLAPDYPAGLWRLTDAPPLLLWYGKPWQAGRSAALVGARSADPLGRESARLLAYELAARRVTVVSGLARGIDSAAHRGALEAGGVTVAVLGSGHAALYPPEHAGLADSIAQTGAVISEFGLETPPAGFRFPQRNRVIAALAQCTVVVQAGARSGALGTAAAAAGMGRPVFAVPGSPAHPLSHGVYALLYTGVPWVASAEDIHLQMGWHEAGRFDQTGEPLQADEMAGIVAVLRNRPCHRQQLGQRLGLSQALLCERLSSLERLGAVVRLGAGYVVAPSEVV